MKLKWEPPIRDGGAPITGYIIEMKDKFGTNFVKAAEVQGPVCTGTVPRLEEGNQYQFRVRAVNKAGPGEPSEATNTHTAKARWRKYILILINRKFVKKEFENTKVHFIIEKIIVQIMFYMKFYTYEDLLEFLFFLFITIY